MIGRFGNMSLQVINYSRAENDDMATGDEKVRCSACLTDDECDRQTDGQTDRQPERQHNCHILAVRLQRVGR